MSIQTAAGQIRRDALHPSDSGWNSITVYNESVVLPLEVALLYLLFGFGNVEFGLIG